MKNAPMVVALSLGVLLPLLLAPSAGASDTQPGDTVVDVYPYDYDGFLYKGASEFHFTCDVIEMNSNGTKALVKVTNITRYWQERGKKQEIRETDIESMPFRDPRGYRTYNAPKAWGSNVNIGDTQWLSVSDLIKK